MAMKKKIILLLAFAYCGSLFSFARQMGKNCDRTAFKPVKECKKSIESGSVDVDLSPLSFFLTI